MNADWDYTVTEVMEEEGFNPDAAPGGIPGACELRDQILANRHLNNHQGRNLEMLVRVLVRAWRMHTNLSGELEEAWLEFFVRKAFVDAPEDVVAAAMLCLEGL